MSYGLEIKRPPYGDHNWQSLEQVLDNWEFGGVEVCGISGMSTQWMQYWDIFDADSFQIYQEANHDDEGRLPADWVKELETIFNQRLKEEGSTKTVRCTAGGLRSTLYRIIDTAVTGKRGLDIFDI